MWPGASTLAKFALVPAGAKASASHTASIAGDYAAGNIFLPRDPKNRELCMGALESACADHDLKLLGWRDVPRNSGVIGRRARDAEPDARLICAAAKAVDPSIVTVLGGVEEFGGRLGHPLLQQQRRGLEARHHDDLGLLPSHARSVRLPLPRLRRLRAPPHRRGGALRRLQGRRGSFPVAAPVFGSFGWRACLVRCLA